MRVSQTVEHEISVGHDGAVRIRLGDLSIAFASHEFLSFAEDVNEAAEVVISTTQEKETRDALDEVEVAGNA